MLMKGIGAEFFMTGCPSWRQPQEWDAVSNNSKHLILAKTQLIQLYIFACTISTQNSNIYLHYKPPFSRLLRHTWVKAVMLFYSYITRRTCGQHYLNILHSRYLQTTTSHTRFGIYSEPHSIVKQVKDNDINM